MNISAESLREQLKVSSSDCIVCERYYGVRSEAVHTTRASYSARARTARKYAPSTQPTLYFLLDVEVWLALSQHGHKDHARCQKWFNSLGSNVRLYFCRFTQVGLLKRLTAGPAREGEEVLYYDRAWNRYEEWCRDPRIMFLPEPPGFNEELRALSSLRHPNSTCWDHLCLMAFARVAGLRLVTMDKTLSDRFADAELLR